MQTMIVSFIKRDVMADFSYPKNVWESVGDTYTEKTKYVHLITKTTA